MKNLKKVLALVVVFAMMVSSVAFAAIYPDVAADADYANAVSVLSDLGMIKGDDKGNFNPDATITRAEFATIVTRLLGVESAATGKADFTDVAADHWATGYIAMAQQQGIIAGYGDGTFGPENPVKYEEAVKMLVCALGYEQMAVSKGGWVAGYLTTAYQIGLLEDVSGTQGAGAPRSLVAQLSYNALDIPMMEQTGFGTDIKYEIMKKTDDHDKVTLLTKMGVYKLGGTILANEKVNYFGESVADKGYVDFKWTDNYDCPHKDFDDEEGSKAFLVGETAVADSIGNRIIVYVEKTSTKYEVIAYEIDESSSSLVIKSKDLDGDVDWTNLYVKYYKEDATKSSKISLETKDEDDEDIFANFTIVENNQKKAISWEEEVEGEDVTKYYELGEDSNAVLEFVDFNDNNKYDILKITKYHHVIVDEVDAAKGRITDADNNRVEFDLDDEEAIVSITDINGNALELKDIAQGDVLAIVCVPSTGYDVEQALKSANYESADIIVLKDSFITGSVNGTTDDGDIIIADKEYKDASGEEIDVSSEGKFWIGIDGETIIGFEGEIAKSGAYAYITDAYFATINKITKGKVTLGVVTKDGFKEYEVANKVTFVNEEGKELKLDVDEEFKDEDTLLSGNLAEALAADVNGEGDTEETAGLGRNVGEALEAFFAEGDVEDAADVANRIVKVEIKNDEVATIVALTESLDSDLEFTYYTYGDEDKEEWKADDLKLGTKMLADDAIVIDIDTVDGEKTSFKDLGYFVDESKYNAILLDADEDGYFAAAVVYGSDSVFAEGDSVAVVSNVVKGINEEGDDIVKVTALKNGEEVNVVFIMEGEEKSETVVENATEADALAIGSIFMYTADAEGIVDKYAVVGTIDWDEESRPFTFDDDFTAPEANYEDGDTFITGFIVENKNVARPKIYVTDIVGDAAAVEAECDSTEDFADNVYALSGVKNANQYTVTGTKKANAKIMTGDYTYGNVSAAYETTTDGTYEVYYVVARLFEGKVVDLIAIDVPEGKSTWTAPLAAPSVVAPVAPVAPVVEEKAEGKEEIVDVFEGFDL